MKPVTALHFAQDGPVGMLRRLHALDSMVKMRIKLLAHGFDARKALLCERLPELAPDQFEALAVFGGGCIVLAGQRSVKRVEHGKNVFDQQLDAAVAVLLAFFLY